MSTENRSLEFWAERIVGLLLVAGIILACFWIARPLLSVIVWGALIAVAFAPLHRVLASAGGGRPKSAASLIVIALLTLVIIPLSFLPSSFERAAEQAAQLTHGWTELRLPSLPDWAAKVPLIGTTIAEKWSILASNSKGLLAGIKPYFGPALQWLAVQGASLGLAVIEMVLAIVLAGIFLSTEAQTTSTLHKMAAKLGGAPGGDLLVVAARTIRSVAQGVIGTALFQGVLSGIGFAIAGVPLAVALGALSFGTAMLQIGTWLVWIPVAIWLSYQGETGWALFTTVLGVFINVLDNVIKPILIGRGAGVPLWIIFVGVIGGMLTIGIIGIFIGPLITAVGYSILAKWLAD